jgi:hypothetical protein
VKKIDNSRATVLQVAVVVADDASRVFRASSECLLAMFQFVYTANSI